MAEGHIGPGIPPPPVITVAPEFLARILVGDRAWLAFDDEQRERAMQMMADLAAWVYLVPGATTGWPSPVPLGVDRRSHQDGEEMARLWSCSR